jgi:hypothetical protein
MHRAFISTERTATTLLLRCALCSPLVITPAVALAQSEQDDELISNDNAAAATTKPEQLPPTKEECLDSHRNTQVAQTQGKLIYAREMAHRCTSLACPGPVISDCARWLNDLDQRIPSVVFEVQVDGQTNRTAMITADGNRVDAWTRGESLRLDPGDHEFRFELPPYQPIVRSVLLGEGIHFRIVQVEFKSQGLPAPLAAASPVAAIPSAPAPRSIPTERPTPVIVYPFLAGGALGLASFATFAAMGKVKQNDLEQHCVPYCTENDLRPMKSLYLIGDISLGAGVASLITAGALYFARPNKPMVATIGAAPLPGGASTVVTYRF